MNALDFVNAVSDGLSWGDIETIEGDIPSKARKIVRSSNLVLRAVQQDKKWSSLKREGTIQLQQPKIDIEMTVTTKYGSNEVFLDGATPIGAWNVNQLFWVDGYDEVYRINEFLGNGYVRINKPWLGADINAAETNVSLVREQYQLPDDYAKMLSNSLVNITTGTEVKYITDDEMREKWAGYGTSVPIEEPTFFTIDGSTPGSNRVLRLNAIGESAYVLRFEYQGQHPKLEYDRTIIEYPEHMMLSLVDTVVARLRRDAEDSARAIQDADLALRERIRGESTSESGEAPIRFTPGFGLHRPRRR